ncbi:MAG: NADH-quinone oxidoreductase subunit C [Chloroflexi bacterium]|nr:NADH-quinone oxidoreductase subunit C [Chloroflexota bacterium]
MEGGALADKQQALVERVERCLASFNPEPEFILDELVITLSPEAVKAACQRARDEPELAIDYLRCLTIVDLGEQLQVVYHLYSTQHRYKMVLKALLPTQRPAIASVTSIWPGADWHEREAYDLFGVSFDGHPRLKPLLLWEGFPGHPLLKSFPLSGPEEADQ